MEIQVCRQKWHSQVLVGLIPPNIRAVDLLSEYPYDADEQNKVYLWRNEKSEWVSFYLKYEIQQR